MATISINSKDNGSKAYGIMGGIDIVVHGKAQLSVEDKATVE